MLHDSVAPAVVAVLSGLVGGVVSGIDLHKIASVGTTTFLGRRLHLVHPEWGLYLALGASVALTGFALALAIMGRQPGGTRVIATAVVLIAVGAAVALTHVGVEKSPAASGESESNLSSTTQSTNSSGTTSTTAPTVTNEEVQHLLSQYEGAYSAENTQQLEALFAPSLTRHNGTHAPEDREEALATYRTQFSQLQNPTYSLTNVNITPTAGEATANAGYSISSQNGTVGGTITFHVVRSEGGLRIDQITIQPHP